MGSGYFGEPNLGNERSSSGSSRKGKKGSSDKPKQPQRGLGVAQLEKIRLMGSNSYLPSLHGPYAPNLPQEDMRMYSSVPAASSSFSYSSSSSSASCGFHGQQNLMMGLGESNIRYGDSQPSSIARWNPDSGMLENQHYAQPNTTRPFLNLQYEDSMQNRRSTGREGSGSQSSETNDSQELDLELRLSL
ncbi:hypothetical protein NMG60_11013439 [Bertholletia excelsa]